MLGNDDESSGKRDPFFCSCPPPHRIAISSLAAISSVQMPIALEPIREPPFSLDSLTGSSSPFPISLIPSHCSRWHIAKRTTYPQSSHSRFAIRKESTGKSKLCTMPAMQCVRRRKREGISFAKKWWFEKKDRSHANSTRNRRGSSIRGGRGRRAHSILTLEASPDRLSLANYLRSPVVFESRLAHYVG